MPNRDEEAKPKVAAPQQAKAKKRATSPKPKPSPQRVMNPTYVDATQFAQTHFRRQGEIVGLMGAAARDGLTAFEKRSSEAYNKVDTAGMMIFELALAAVPAFSAFSSALHELKSGDKAIALVRQLRSLGDHTHEGLETAKRATEVVEGVAQAHETLSEHGAQNEEQERAEFQIEQLSSLRDMMEEGTAARWSREDQIQNLMRLGEYTDASVDLIKLVKDTLGPMPAPSDIKKVVHPVAERFEIQLYVDYYLEAGKVTMHTVNVDDSTRVDWDGIPPAVRQRFFDTNNGDLLMNHPKLKRTTRSQFASPYSGHRF